MNRKKKINASFEFHAQDSFIAPCLIVLIVRVTVQLGTLRLLLVGPDTEQQWHVATCTTYILSESYRMKQWLINIALKRLRDWHTKKFWPWIYFSTFIDDPYSLNLDKITPLFTNLKPGVYQTYIFFYPRPWLNQYRSQLYEINLISSIKKLIPLLHFSGHISFWIIRKWPLIFSTISTSTKGYKGFFCV